MASNSLIVNALLGCATPSLYGSIVVDFADFQRFSCHALDYYCAKEGHSCEQPSGAEAPAEMSVQHRSETD